jgi:hypothetical protein
MPKENNTSYFCIPCALFDIQRINYNVFLTQIKHSMLDIVLSAAYRTPSNGDKL